ncbi:MAG TPA: bifunctional [glutamine synthetase] adenylyltransferase/[glutamine synthetase]-adenylyl-L-tyrosine phosphorylase [Aeromicrobium sp.]|nr:bifunctional [glutamine synthetase] adenylyltransferase/[glutamine synthetase]-adenylyl-L-tyrosine phosphorylase [Aeromicrobium sp.]HKY57765.1 bifunctional [glutamine synthetase] adenylyltransferase/[glutamine synthetase]-adenylyl-L-tyrosine phosphorylase [Aeromicrobium sp.]
MADPMALARSGFRDGDRAARLIEDLPGIPADLVQRLALAADPDLALEQVAALAEHIGEERVWAAVADPATLERLVLVMGTSQALGEFIVRHPEALDDLCSAAPVGALVGGAPDADALRVAYRRELVSIAGRDLDGATSFVESSGELADLAMATLGAALRIASDGDPDASACRLAVIAMGKTGGRELNYCSDVDVIFVYDGDAQVAARLASTMMRICSEHTTAGTIWEVDANLRPEGRDGPLVRTLSSHVQYYERWAAAWEFQALLKARYAAGDAELAAEYLAAIQPMVWDASAKPDFVDAARTMRQRVVENIPANKRDRELKLGAGGLRDVEFAVQLLQLVHGRGDESLRSPTTLLALAELTRGGYVGRRDGSALEDSYEFLRTLEHRIQLFRLRRTHLMPDDAESLRRLGRSMGYRHNPAEDLEKEWRAHRRVVRSLHQKLFYRPLLEAVAAIPTEGLRLTPEAARQRLEALGFSDPKRALTDIEALTSGVSRRASIQRSLLPAMLDWLSESAMPDAGLHAFRRISESLGDSPWYLRNLRDEGTAAERLAQALGSSRYVAELVMRAPESVAMLGDDEELVPRDIDRLDLEMRQAVERSTSLRGAARTIRRLRRRELTRISAADTLGLLDIHQVGEALSDVSAMTLTAALEASVAAFEEDHGTLPTRFAIVLMGRLGGHEVGYSSDADVMFVHQPVEGAGDVEAAKAATEVATSLRAMLAAPSADPPLEVDADLRPDGRNGPLVRSLDAYRTYYAQWSAVWEAQALLRARPVIGDPGLCAAFTELIDPLRWPEAGIPDDDVREIRRIKARVDSERLPRGADPATHFKLGRGGLADLEWTVQLLQMRHAHAVPGLRTTRTVDAIRAAAEADLVTAADAESLIEAWRFVSRIRNAGFLVRGKPVSSLDELANERAGVASLMGYPESEPLMDDYRRITRHARQVVERLFY